TLLAHLAWWWQRTGLAGQVFRFSYEDRAWTAGQIVREIRSRLLSPADHARADAMPEAAQAEQVAQLLRASRQRSPTPSPRPGRTTSGTCSPGWPAAGPWSWPDPARPRPGSPPPAPAP